MGFVEELALIDSLSTRCGKKERLCSPQMKKEGLVMTVTRNLMLEQAFSDRISTLKHHDNGSSMAIDLIEKTTQELAKTAAVNQDVYDFALQYVEEQVNFFEKQSSLINTLHSFFTAMPPEVRVMYNTFLGDTKGAAYMVICKHLDPSPLDLFEFGRHSGLAPLYAHPLLFCAIGCILNR